MFKTLPMIFRSVRKFLLTRVSPCPVPRSVGQVPRRVREWAHCRTCHTPRAAVGLGHCRLVSRLRASQARADATLQPTQGRCRLEVRRWSQHVSYCLIWESSVDADSSDRWKGNPDYPYRTHPQLKVQRIPTLIRFGKVRCLTLLTRRLTCTILNSKDLANDWWKVSATTLPWLKTSLQLSSESFSECNKYAVYVTILFDTCHSQSESENESSSRMLSSIMLSAMLSMLLSFELNRLLSVRLLSLFLLDLERLSFLLLNLSSTSLNLTFMSSTDAVSDWFL